MMMKTTHLLAAVMASILLLSGCSTGLLYTHTTRPLDLHLDRTRVIETGHQGDVKHIQYQVSVTWDSNAIGDIAKKNGLEMVYYADLEILSVLGLWSRFTVHVYGE